VEGKIFSKKIKEILKIIDNGLGYLVERQKAVLV